MVMGLFNHKPFFVKFYGAKYSTHYSYILMEYMAKGDLRARIRRERLKQADKAFHGLGISKDTSPSQEDHGKNVSPGSGSTLHS